jgi:hypothetical protein
MSVSGSAGDWGVILWFRLGVALLPLTCVRLVRLLAGDRVE